jgi:hypothetical protein
MGMVRTSTTIALDEAAVYDPKEARVRILQCGMNGPAQQTKDSDD